MGLLDLLQNGQPEEQPFGYRDISGLGGFNFGQMEKPQGIIIHHTGGGGTPEGVMETFKQRNFPAQFIMDRDGTIVRALPDGMRGQHLRPSQINGLTNSNALGIEIIAKDDNDLTDAQKASASKWLTETQSQYGIPAANVFGHGEVNNHKQATEGSSIVNAWRQANRLPSRPDLGEPAAPTGADLPMSQRTLMAYAGRDRPAALPFEAEIQAASKETGVPAAIIRAMGTQESGLNPNVRDGRSGEIGMFQVKPTTAAQPGYGVDPLDPAQLRDPAANIRFGARYLAARARDAGVRDWNDPAQAAKGLAAYNGGGDPNYAQNVLRYVNQPTSAPQVAQRRPLNPTVTAAAERGQGPAADRRPPSGAYSEGPSYMPARQMADTTSADNAGILEFLRQQMGQGQEIALPGQSAPGGLGGLGGFRVPEGSGAPPVSTAAAPRDVASLIPSSTPNPLAFFGKPAQENQQAASEREGKVALARMLVAKGATPEQAAGIINSPAALQMFVGDKQRAETQGLEREKFEFSKKNVEADNRRADEAGMSAPRKILRDLGIEPGHPEYKEKYSKLAGLGNGASAEVAQRKADAAELGLTKDDPRYVPYVLSGNVPKENQQTLTATDKKEFYKAEDALPAIDNTIETLKRARDLNRKTYTGVTAKARGLLGTALPDSLVPNWAAEPNRAEATREFGQIMSMEAIKSMSETLKGATTDREMDRFTEILGDPSTPPDIRERTIDRMISLTQRQREIAAQRIQQLRGGEYFKPGDRQAQTGTPAAPAPAPSQDKLPRAAPDRAALEAEARRRKLIP